MFTFLKCLLQLGDKNHNSHQAPCIRVLIFHDPNIQHFSLHTLSRKNRNKETKAINLVDRYPLPWISNSPGNNFKLETRLTRFQYVQ